MTKVEIDGVEYLPAVDISELPRCRGNRNFTPVDDLRKVAIRDTEREKELETDLKEMADVCLTKQCKIVELEAELSTLREQSKRNCYTLGEPLEEGELLQPHTLYWELDKDGDLLPRMYFWQLLKPNGRKFYLDPRPLPTLPDPEESRLVKRLKSLQRRASGSYDDHVRVDSGTLAQVLKEMEKPKE